MSVKDAGLRRFAAGIMGAIDAGAHDTADDILDERDNRVPIDTGELLDTGRVVKVEEGMYQVREGDGLPDSRAHWTEYGTSRMPAQPHMTPAAEMHRPNLAKNIAARLKALEQRSRV
jgi:hypothetical protein